MIGKVTGASATPEWPAQSSLALLSGGYALSVLSNLGTIMAHWAVIQAFGLDISSGAAIWCVLIVSASMLLPISINGLGLQESVYVVVLASYGVPTANALGVALIMRLLMVCFSLLGGVLSLGWNRSGSQRKQGLLNFEPKVKE
jgi:uncharacterized membrane protein YbhN (UPF0104 family)